MTIEKIEILFSAKRLQPYYDMFEANEDKAIEYYLLNTQISEALYPVLSTFEIILRNAIHNSCTQHFKKEDWYKDLTDKKLTQQIRIAEDKIAAAAKTITADRVISELTLGFWTSLFNKQYAKILWKPLMYALPKISADVKHRDKIAFKLNQIRKFRNRIFHYEGICFDLQSLITNYSYLLETFGWIDESALEWIMKINRFERLYLNAESYLLNEALIR